MFTTADFFGYFHIVVFTGHVCVINCNRNQKNSGRIGTGLDLVPVEKPVFMSETVLRKKI